MEKKLNAHVEYARKKLYSGNESAREALRKLGKKGAQVRWAKRRSELEIKEELRLLKKEESLADVYAKLRQGNEIKFPPR